MPPPSVTFVSYYWAPYRSGLTVYAGALARALAARGVAVRVLCGRHDPDAPADETIGGVEVRRLPVRLRYDRGILVPGLVPAAVGAARRGDVVVTVAPLAEAGVIAGLAPRDRTVLLYVCDPDVPAGAVGRLLIAAVDASARIAVARSTVVAALSHDYAAHSRVLAGAGRPVVAIPPPVNAHRFAPAEPLAAITAIARPGVVSVGFLGRLVHEKGLDRLVAAAARMREPGRLLLAGDSAGVAGGGVRDALVAQAAALGVDVTFLGPLAQSDVNAFYSSVDVLCLPSVNPLEAYGMVQVEAMLCGTPVVASALPGVREIIQATGMGELVAPGDVDALAAALDAVGADPDRYRRDRATVIARLRLGESVGRFAAAVLSLGGASGARR